MNDNVIPIKPDDEPYGYQIFEDYIAVVDKKGDMAIGFTNTGPSIVSGLLAYSYERKELAQILWAAAYLLDSEERWRKGEYVGKDYE